MKKMLIVIAIILQAFSLSKTEIPPATALQIESTKDKDGRLHLFLLDFKGRVHYSRQPLKNASSWNIYKILESKIEMRGDYAGPDINVEFNRIAAGMVPEGSIAVYGLDRGNAVWVSYQGTNTDSWTPWKRYGTGSDFKQLIALKDDNSQRAYGLRTNGSVIFCYMKSAANGGPMDSRWWSGWQNIYGTNLKQIDCAFTPIPGRFGTHAWPYVFALSNDGSAYYSRESTGSMLRWENWTSLGGKDLKKIKAGKNADGRLILFAIGGDNDTYERHQLTKDGSWSEWKTILGSSNFQDIACTINQAGQVHFFGLHNDGSVEVIWQVNPGSDAWSGWLPFGGSNVRSIKCDQTENGRAVIYAIGGDGKVYYRWQVVPNGDWSQWDLLVK